MFDRIDAFLPYITLILKIRFFLSNSIIGHWWRKFHIRWVLIVWRILHGYYTYDMSAPLYHRAEHMKKLKFMSIVKKCLSGWWFSVKILQMGCDTCNTFILPHLLGIVDIISKSSTWIIAKLHRHKSSYVLSPHSRQKIEPYLHRRRSVTTLSYATSSEGVSIWLVLSVRLMAGRQIRLDTCSFQHSDILITSGRSHWQHLFWFLYLKVITRSMIPNVLRFYLPLIFLHRMSHPDRFLTMCAICEVTQVNTRAIY